MVGNNWKMLYLLLFFLSFVTRKIYKENSLKKFVLKIMTFFQKLS